MGENNIMKKKLLALFIICAFALSILAACGKSGGDTPAPAGSGSEAPAGSGAVAPAGESAEYTFYLTRHGQTVFNVSGIAQGWCDSPLTADGVAMAKQLGVSMADIPFDKAYTSLSGRAYETAEYIINGRDIPLIIDKDLRETHLGDLEGTLPGTDTRSTERIMDYEGGWHDVNGESMKDTAERVAGAIERIIAENPNGGTFLVTSHGGAITGYMDYLCGYHNIAGGAPGDKWNEFMATWKGAMPNCAVSIVKYKDGVYTVETISDVSYLGDLAPSPGE